MRPASRARPFFRFLALPCLFYLIVDAGCAPQWETAKEPLRQSKWACDKEADDLMQRGDIEEAVIRHQKYLEKFPDNALALYHLGYAYGRMGDHIKEVAFYNKAVALGLKNEQIYFNLGMAYGESNQPDQAVRAFLMGLEINPESLDNRFGLAMAYHQKGASQKAVEQLKKILKIDASYSQAREWLERIEKK
ncbi:MAG: tetratricopeptide repeat protein [Pseudomonadota bacterium]